MKYYKYIHHLKKKNDTKIWKFCIGDYVQVGLTFFENTKKKRVQFFEGIVIAIRSNYANQKMITIRRPGSFGIERILASNSPQIQNLKVIESQKFKKSKLFYLRKRIGKEAFG